MFFFLIFPVSYSSAATVSTSPKNIHMFAPLPKQIINNANAKEIEQIFDQRSVATLTPFNFIAYGIRYAIMTGVPVESVLLILSIPIIGTLVVFLRYIIGVPTLGISHTIVFAVTFFITGIAFGSVLFVTLLLGTLLTRLLFKRVRIMQLTKVSLSMLVISVLILIAIVMSLRYHLIQPSQISIFPILLFILLSERVVALQLEKDIFRAFGITLLTLFIGGIGFIAVSTPFMQTLLLIYPETLLLLIPINWFIGRYFGLRLTEYFRFIPNIHYANK